MSQIEKDPLQPENEIEEIGIVSGRSRLNESNMEGINGLSPTNFYTPSKRKGLLEYLQPKTPTGEKYDRYGRKKSAGEYDAYDYPQERNDQQIETAEREAIHMIQSVHVDDDEVQDVTPKNLKQKSFDKKSSDKPPRTLPKIMANNEALYRSLNLPSDPTGLQGAAFQSRLPYEQMTQIETAAFDSILSEYPEGKNIFLAIRNRILQMWLKNPMVQLCKEDASEKLESPLNSNKKLAVQIHAFLERNGYINFGVYKHVQPIPQSKGKVIVIGAGISGLTAARQLKSFGMDVVIIEARDRVGGRIASFRKGPYLGDLGAMLIPGLGGNPMMVLSKQINMELMKINLACPLYVAYASSTQSQSLSQWKTVTKNKAEMIEREFNRLLEATSYISHEVMKIEGNKKPLSLEQALKFVIEQQEKQVKKKQLVHIKLNIKLQEDLKTVYNKILLANDNIDKYKPKIEMKDGSAPYDAAKEFEKRHKNKKYRDATLEYARLREEEETLTEKLDQLAKNSPADTYMSSLDAQVLGWHLASLENLNDAPLQDLSLKDWAHDDGFAFSGPLLTVRNGFDSVPKALSEGLDIKYNTEVRKINYSNAGCEIVTCNARNKSNLSTHNADAVLCTLPLGVLKGCIEEQKDVTKVEFSPPLPKWKVDSIRNLGYGNSNKVLLCFDRIFWDQSGHMLGQTSITEESRGEFFCFYSIYKSPVLCALIAGKAASNVEKLPDEVVVGRCISVLKGIFGSQSVPNPKESIVTRWKQDPWSKGSNSFPATGSSGNDYDVLAEPIAPRKEKSPNGCQRGDTNARIYFAGEHTIRNYPGTVHGALLSGLREAGKIADCYLGCSY